MLEMIWALGAIILIDVVLGGENAIVIAMASRRLPPNLRKRAMLWGTVGAVAVRFACVAALTYLLMIPGLRLIGGLALLYIAWTLVRNTEETEHEVAAASTFWGAMATIVWADWLIIFGLLVSVPIILFGSTIVAKIMERWPRTIWIGAGVLSSSCWSNDLRRTVIKGIYQCNG